MSIESGEEVPLKDLIDVCADDIARELSRTIAQWNAVLGIGSPWDDDDDEFEVTREQINALTEKLHSWMLMMLQHAAEVKRRAEAGK